MAKTRGAVDWKADMSGRVSLLVHGDLASQHVTDRTRQYSKKLILADQLRRAGKPIDIVDGQGFADLVAEYPARNEQNILKTWLPSILGNAPGKRCRPLHLGKRRESVFHGMRAHCFADIVLLTPQAFH